MNRVAAKMKEVETYNYSMRQRMLSDMESVKVREEQLERFNEQLLQKERGLIK